MIMLFLVFVYVGLFTIGGGMVAIPLILQEVVGRGWISEATFYSMVAIAQSTPGPVGANVATYVGYELYGIPGALLATFGFVLPSFLIVSTLAGLLRKYRQSSLVIHWFYYIKAAIVGLIGYTLFKMVQLILLHQDTSIHVEWKELALFAGLIVIFYVLRKRPWIVILIGAGLGMLFL